MALFAEETAKAAVLTIQQVAQHAFAAGFRGGSLVSAIAAAEAESGFDTDAVNNNLHQTTAGGDLILGPTGRPILLSLPRSGQQMLPLGSIQPLGDGRYGKVVSHCRGLWQFNDKVHDRIPTDAMAFAPATAASCAWRVSRHGRDWGKWVVMQNGTAWEAGRLARARSAARAIDFSVMIGTVNERVQARVTGGSIRSTPAGARIRALHQADTGRLLSGPVQAAITQGVQTSIKLWWQVQWDSGHTGWVSEDLLIRSSTLDLQPAQPVYAGAPHEATGVPVTPTLTWCTGANTASQKLYVGRTATLPEADLKQTGLFNEWKPAQPLLPYTSYYWRVDTISAQGAVLPGPTWYFLTRPPEPAALSIAGVTTSEPVLQPGFTTQITCQTQSAAGQPVLYATSLHRVNATPLIDTVLEVPRFAPAGSGSFSRSFAVPLNTPQGAWTLLVRLVQDYNGNGVIDDFETVIAEKRVTVTVGSAGPLVSNLAVTPATMAPGQKAAITANVTALPGSSLTTLRLFRAEGETAPGTYTLVQTANMNNNASYTASFLDQPPSIRRYWYALQAADNLGRSAPDGPYFRPLSVRVTIGDTQPPVIQWNGFADGSRLAPDFFAFSGTITDNDVIESATYNFDGGTWENMNPANWLIYSPGVAGPHRLTIRATDRSGNTAMDSRTFYIPGTSNSSDFDEDQTFTTPSEHSPNWLVSLTGDAQITGGKLGATGESDSAELSRYKPPPTWARSVEVSWKCGLEGSQLSWDRIFFGPLIVRLTQLNAGSWQLQAGEANSPATVALVPIGATATPGFSVLLRMTGTQFYTRVVTANGSPQVVAESTQTITNLPTVSPGTATFRTGGTSLGPGWLDDVSFRALRANQSFVCRQIRPLTVTATERTFAIDWEAVPGRVYQLQVLDPSTGQWVFTGAPATPTGLIGTQTLTFPRSRGSALIRARQLLP